MGRNGLVVQETEPRGVKTLSLNFTHVSTYSFHTEVRGDVEPGTSHVFTYSYHTEVRGDVEPGTGTLFLASLAFNMDILRTATLVPLS